MARAMKDSGIAWIGEIPLDWKIGRIKYNFYLKGRIGWQGLKADEFTDEGPYLVTGTDFDNGRVNWNACYHITQERYDEAPEIHVQNNDLLITKDGTVGKVAIIEKKPEQVSLNSHLLIMRPLNARYSNRFLFWVIQSSVFIRFFSLSQSGTIMASLTQEKITNFSYALPPRSEQDKIASFLEKECTRIDAVIERTRASIEEYKKLKQAVITQAVTKGIRPNRPMKDSGINWIGKIPEDWTCTILKRHCSFQTGSTPETKNEQWFNGDLDWFTPVDFNDKYYLVNSSRKLSSLAKRDGVATIIPSNTVMIIGIGGTAGKIGFTKYECSCNQQITAIMGDDKLSQKYLMYWMIANTKRIKDTALFSTLPIINNQTIGQYCLLLPNTIEEQLEIAGYLDSKVAEADKIITRKNNLLQMIEVYKKSLIYEYVTGKKEVSIL